LILCCKTPSDVVTQQQSRLILLCVRRCCRYGIGSIAWHKVICFANTPFTKIHTRALANEKPGSSLYVCTEPDD
jgi:hypothetical protein